MKLTWLTQGGFLLESEQQKILIDPYLSDSVAKQNPANTRRIPVAPVYLELQPDILICTHDHLDHTDPETVCHYLQRQSPVTVLAPQKAWEHLRTFGGEHNYILFNRHTQWTKKNIRFTAVPAAHSDPHPIGVVIETENKTVYFTGDTLYNSEIFPCLPKKIDLLILPVNGVGNNMNITDAARFAKRVRAELVIPCHYGLFDSIDPETFPCPNKKILEPYKEILL